MKGSDDGYEVRQHDQTQNDDDEDDAQPPSGLGGRAGIRGALLASTSGGQRALVQCQLLPKLLRDLHDLCPCQVDGDGPSAAALTLCTLSRLLTGLCCRFGEIYICIYLINA